MNLNKAILIGNLTKDPEARTTPSGHSVASFSLATNRSWTDQSGQKQTKAEFHNIVAWGKLADICAQYLKKGALVMIEGRIENRSWDAPDGTKKYRTEIIAENMQMGPRPSGSSGTYAKKEEYDAPQGANPAEQSNEEIELKDIPF
jgi:single-strand DNA-binding protein